MKKHYNIKNIILGLIAVMQFASCEDFLDRKPLKEYGETSVWGDLAMIEHFVNDIYWYIGHSFDRPMIGVFTDESMFDPGSDQGHGNAGLQRAIRFSFHDGVCP